jgi:CIC family chloride channel protein
MSPEEYRKMRSMAELRKEGLTGLMAVRMAIFRLTNWVVNQAKLADYTFNVIVALIIGLLGGFGAVAFHYLIGGVQKLSWGSMEPLLEHFTAVPLWAKILIPALGGLIIGPLVYLFAREAKGHGVPEVMEAVARKGGVMRPRVVLAKFIGSAITIGTGGSAGREGPIVQIGSAIGSVVGQFLRVSAGRMKTYVGCGAAAGIAATFNAPLAGALFAVEIILGDFAVHQFSPIVISSVIATVVSRHFLGDYPAFQPPQYVLVSPWEFFSYLVLGVVAALVGLAFIRILYWSEDRFEDMKIIPGWLRPAIGGVLVGCVAIFFPQIYGSGYGSVDLALEGHLGWALLGALLVAKIVGTSLTLGSGGSGGVFAPSLFLGAMTGGVVGTGAHALFPEHTAAPGAYALVGMGAVVAATTHAPITAILIIFEMTNEYSIILPLMTACIISTLFAKWMSKESIYTMKLIRRGVDIYQGQELNVLKPLSVRDVMEEDVDVFERQLTLPAMIDRLTRSPHLRFYVVDEEQRLCGVISSRDLRQLVREESSLSDLIVAQDLANPDVRSVTADDNLDLVMRLFGRAYVDELPVVDSAESKRIIGTVHRAHVIELYNRAIFKRDLAGTLGTNVDSLAAGSVKTVELAEGYALAEVEAPGLFDGKTIAELDVRAKYGVEILVIKASPPGRKNDGKGAFLKKVPSPNVRIHRGDILLVAGDPARIDRLRRF